MTMIHTTQDTSTENKTSEHYFYSRYFYSQYQEIKDNAVDSTVSILRFSSPELRQHLINELSKNSMVQGDSGLMGNPVFEVLFPWQTQSKAMAQFGDDLLHKDVADMLVDSIPVPYKHQARAWEILNDDDSINSLIVTSGTGSGKTECFMVPILDDLVKEQEQQTERLQGVRALFLYPLNALINSQRERLGDWTKALGDDLRFCLYNGDTPNTVPKKTQDNTNEVLSRETLRKDTPPILVTNATMLEYMLIRQKDAPIIQQSQKKLRWIVLDEAHSYTGSTAAELSLLLRRVMLAFDVNPSEVHFVATSATIGDDEESVSKLKDFLANLAGVSRQQIHIITAKREVTPIAVKAIYNDKTPSLKTIVSIDAGNPLSIERYEALSNHPFAQRLRASFVKVNKGEDKVHNITTVSNQLQSLYQQLRDDIRALTKNSLEIDSTQYLLQWLDVCANTQAYEDKPAFLPLRGHFFQRTLSGLYACVNADCEGKHNTPLAGNDSDGKPVWDFGYLYTNHRSHCQHCEFPVYEVSYCKECQTPHLLFESNLLIDTQLDTQLINKTQDIQPSRETANTNNITTNNTHEKLTQFNRYKENEFTIEDDGLDDDISTHSKDGNDYASNSPNFYPKLILPHWRCQQELSDRQLNDEGVLIKESRKNKDADQIKYPFELAYLDKGGIKRVFRKNITTSDNEPSKDITTIAIKEVTESLNSLQHCYFCEAKSEKRNVIKTVNLGAPFYMSAAAPLLLEHCKAFPENTDSKPFSGKRMITFTDSRQGTARITMKLRQDSERRSLRHIVYYSLAQELESNPLSADEIAEKNRKVKELHGTCEQLAQTGIPNIEEVIEDTKKKIAILQAECANELSPPALPWKDLVKKITDHPEFEFLSRSVAKIAEVNHIVDDYGKAELLLLNEIAYRPRNANSMETMGLLAISYPKIKEIDINNFNEWQSLGLTKQDWHDYLHLLLDFYVRDQKAIEISENQINSLTTRFFGYKQLVPADAELKLSPQDARKTQEWLQVNADRGNSSIRLIRLLALATGLDLTQSASQDLINLILNRAFTDLTRYNILTPKPLSGNIQAYQLDFNKVCLSIPIDVWVCPVTRRFLSTTFKKITPYLPAHVNIMKLKDKIDKYTCTPVKMPIFKPTPGVLRFKEEAEQWLETNKTIKELREKNLWSDVASDVILEAGIIVTEEHSAQINSNTLKRYESQFKQGNINILNCSTTMEMGVDIGGISSVAMNNVPPHPANYLQRTGRAGRNKESTAIAFTLCKDNPHEQMVFNNTNWAFTTKIDPPYITLNSARIVQRHINAYLLAHYLPIIMPKNASAITLNSGWFFFGWNEIYFNSIQAAVETIVRDISEDRAEGISEVAEKDDRETDFEKITQKLKENTPVELMLSELKTLKRQTNRDSKVEKDINHIKDSKALSSKPFIKIIDNSIKDLESAQRYINEKVARRIKEYMSFDTSKNRSSSYLSKLIFDICSATASYLLSDLARYNFLPRYGFPSGLIEFDIFSKHVKPHKIKKGHDNNSRIDNLVAVQGSKPVRDIAIAIREYAPGNEVVVDGLVYQSAGLELSRYYSHSDSNDAQIISKFAYCNNCGAMDDYGNESKSNDSGDSKSKPIECSTCGHVIPENKVTQYVEPMGFKVDYFAIPHNSIEHQSYVPVQDPAIQAMGERLSLISPDIGFYRIDAEGLVFHRSSGTYGHGYFICLGCGRAESSRHDKQSPKFDEQRLNFLKHVPMKPLSKGQLSKEELIAGACDTEGKGHLAQHLHLGARDTTNVVELYLKRPTDKQYQEKEGVDNTTGKPYFNIEEDSVILYTLAAALRDSLAQCHGINAEELGFGVKEVRHENEEVGAISIYDKASGGAGFSSTADQYFDQMFEKLEQVLACADNCDAACHSCLLTYDTRFISDKLDRHQGLAYLQSIKNSLSLPADARNLLPQASYCRVNIATRIAQKFDKGYNQIRLYLQGDPQEWAISEALTDRVSQWNFSNIEVEIVINKDSVSKLDNVTKLQLGHLNSLSKVSIVSLKDNVNPLIANYLLQMTRFDKAKELGIVFTLATTDRNAYIPNQDYWEVAKDKLVVETKSACLPEVNILSASVLQPDSAHNYKNINIKDELDVKMKEFGREFWAIMYQYPILKQKVASREEITKIEYSDPYVRSPFTALLLTRVLYSLKMNYGQDWAEPNIIVKTSFDYRNNNKTARLFYHDWLDDRVQEKVLSDFLLSLGLETDVKIYDKSNLEHHRTLKIYWGDHSVTTISLDQGLGFIQSQVDRQYSFNHNVASQVDELNRLMDDVFRLKTDEGKEHKVYIGHKA